MNRRLPDEQKVHRRNKMVLISTSPESLKQLSITSTFYIIDTVLELSVETVLKLHR